MIEQAAIEKFQDILVQGHVLEPAKRVKLGLGASPSSPARRSDPWRHRGGAASPKVELRDVNLRYFGLEGETEALKGISLSVAPGEFVAIIGQSGCGKSTLLSLISGILEPTDGAVLVDGKPVAGPSRKVGYMLQQDYLFEWRTILENAVLGAEIQGADMAKARAARDRAAHPLRPRPVPALSAAAALGRDAPAGGARAHALHRARRRAARRAVLGARLRRRGWRSPTR